jgi:hypothetical protein
MVLHNIRTKFPVRLSIPMYFLSARFLLVMRIFALPSLRLEHATALLTAAESLALLLHDLADLH